MKVSRILAALLVTVFIIGGLSCGEKQDEKTAESEKDFRIPDSLLSPKDRFNLVVDDYHPVKGGVIGNEEIEVHYPPTEIYDFLSRRVFGIAFDSYNEVKELIGPPSADKVVCVGAKDLDEYKFLHKKEWWYYGTIKGDTIYFEPYQLMLKRHDRVSGQSVAQIAFRQKLAQMALRKRSGGKIPIWMREGMASHIAEENAVVKAGAAQWRDEFSNFRATEAELNSYLEVAEGMALTRVAFYIALQMFENLLGISSMEEILSFLDELDDGKTLDEASESVFGLDYAALIEEIDDYRAVPEPGWKR